MCERGGRLESLEYSGWYLLSAGRADSLLGDPGLEKETRESGRAVAGPRTSAGDGVMKTSLLSLFVEVRDKREVRVGGRSSGRRALGGLIFFRLLSKSIVSGVKLKVPLSLLIP